MADQTISQEPFHKDSVNSETKFPPNSPLPENPRIFPVYNYFLYNIVSVLEELANDKDDRLKTRIQTVADHFIESLNHCQMDCACFADSRNQSIGEARNAASALKEMLERPILKNMVTGSASKLALIGDKLYRARPPITGNMELSFLKDDIGSILKSIGATTVATSTSLGARPSPPPSRLITRESLPDALQNAVRKYLAVPDTGDPDTLEPSGQQMDIIVEGSEQANKVTLIHQIAQPPTHYHQPTTKTALSPS